MLANSACISAAAGWTHALQKRQGVVEDSEVCGGRSVNGARNPRRRGLAHWCTALARGTLAAARGAAPPLSATLFVKLQYVC